MTNQRKREDFSGDPLVPLLNLVCLLIPLLLYGAVFTRLVILDVKAEKFDDGPPPVDPRQEPLNLTVMITDQGFHFKVSPKHRMAWMEISGPGDTSPHIPRKDEGFDFASLSEKLRSIKKNHGSETRIYLGAEDDIPFDMIVRAMDHARGPDDSLFPDVTLIRGVV